MIMDYILHSTKYTQVEKTYLNRCRIFLKVETLSDLVNAAGTHLLSASYFCMEEAILPTTVLWPHQPRPGPKHRSLWQKFLDEWCITPSFTLQQPLGLWTGDIVLKWNAYYDTTIHTVLIQHTSGWSHYSAFDRQRRHWIVDRTSQVVDTTPPHQLTTLLPMDIIKKRY